VLSGVLLFVSCLRRKLDKLNATLKTAREALHAIRAQKKAQEPNN
jgi:hypothetical protein